MLVRAQFGSVRKLSIPRDSSAEIPGHGTGKINGAYAIGGAPLMIETVEDFLGNGLEIDHLIEVDFEDFPAFIDAMGGITVNNKTQDLRAGVRQLLPRLQPPQGRARAERPARAGLRARAQEPVCAGRERPRPRRAPAGGAQRHPRPAALPLHVHPAAAGELARAPDDPHRPQGPGADGAWPRTWPPAESGDTRVLEPSSFGTGDLLYSDSEKSVRGERAAGRASRTTRTKPRPSTSSNRTLVGGLGVRPSSSRTWSSELEPESDEESPLPSLRSPCCSWPCRSRCCRSRSP